MIRPDKNIPSPNNIIPNNLEDLHKIVRQIDRNKISNKQETIFDFFKSALESAGGKYFENINDLYKLFNQKNYLVRREDPKKIAYLVGKNQPIKVSLDKEINNEYGNCVSWNYSQGSRGISTAILEGHGELNGLVTIIGFEPNNNATINHNISKNPGQAGTDRALVRAMEGDIRFEDIKFIILRAPAINFPEDEMSDQEKEAFDDFIDNESQNKPKKSIPQIFRGFTFNQEKRGLAN